MNKKLVFFVLFFSVLSFSCKNEKDSNNTKKVNDIKAVESVKTIDTSQKNIENKPKSNVKLSEITFVEKEFDFGTLNQGDKVVHVFEFKNTGKNDLIITKAFSSCGCTVPDYPKKPIKPGQKSKIKVSYDSSWKTGDQKKYVTMFLNTEKKFEQIIIKAKIKDDVNKKKKDSSTINKNK